jgi:phage shock protein A
LSRLFQADLHAVLDHIEEPEALLKQSVREMAEELMKCEQHLKEMRGEHSQLCRRAAGIEETLVDMDRELGLCLASDNDELARKLLRRKLQAQKVLKGIAARAMVIESDLTEQQLLLEDNRAAYESMCQEVQLVANDLQVAEILGGRESGYADFEIAVSDTDVEIALLQEKQKREGL